MNELEEIINKGLEELKPQFLADDFKYDASTLWTIEVVLAGWFEIVHRVRLLLVL